MTYVLMATSVDVATCVVLTKHVKLHTYDETVNICLANYQIKLRFMLDDLYSYVYLVSSGRHSSYRL